MNKLKAHGLHLTVAASLLLTSAAPSYAQQLVAPTTESVTALPSDGATPESTVSLAQAPVEAAYGTSIKGKTQVERALGKCAGSILGGAILGALVGAAANNTGRGAAIGAGIGAGVCAYIMVVASKQDKQALRDAQLQAINSGQTYQTTWTTADGQPAIANVDVSPIVKVSAPKTKETLRCRRARTTLTIAESPQGFDDAVCLVGDTWLTGKDLKKMGINDTDVTV